MSGTKEQSRSHIHQLFWVRKRLQVLILELCDYGKSEDLVPKPHTQ